MSNADLDRAIEPPLGFDVEAMEATAEALANPSSIQARGLCGGRWKNKSKTIGATIENGTGALSVDKDMNLGNGFSANVESSGGFDGSVRLSAVVYYRERSNKCIGIPYRWDFRYADIDFVAEMDGAIEMNNTLTIEHQMRLWEEIIPLAGFTKTILIANVLTLDLKAYLHLHLALDLETRLSITNQIKADQDYDLRGRYEKHLRCDSDGCEDRSASDWGIEFIPVDRASSNTQTTIDITLRPSAELKLGVKVDVGIWGQFEETVFDGVVAVGVDVPIRLYWTYGNACSDANADGRNEQVSGSLVDVKLRVYAYVQGRLLGNNTKEFISVKVPNGWTRKYLNSLRDVDQWVPVAEKHLLLKVLSEGENSPLEPTINRAGLFRVGGRDFEGVELGPVRSCYPFNAAPTYRLDFGDGVEQLYRVTGSSLAVPHDWPDNGANRTIRARVEFDALGRSIKGPWVEVQIDRNGNLRVDLTTPVLRLGTGPAGVELQWENNGAARGFNIYRDGQYVDTVRDSSSWPLINEDGAEHRYVVVAFDDETDTYTSKSNEVTFANNPAAGGDRPAAIVSMGDSFISGEGGRWFGNALSASKAGTDRGRTSYVGGSDETDCHRSDVAEVNSAGIAGVVPVNLACSGALARHVRDTAFKGEQAQVEQLRETAATHDVEMIVLSIGGNDLGFGPILSDCMQSYVADRSPCRHNNIWGDIVRDVVPEVRSTIEAIKATMSEAGNTDYRLVLQSYPSPVPRSSENRYSGRSERIEGGCGFFDADLDWARDTIVPILDDRYRALANEMDIEFLSLRDALQGKEVCGFDAARASTSRPGTDAGQDARLEWVRFGNALLGGSQGELAELLHPNALGQAALGDCLAQVWQRDGNGVHRCTRTGARPTDMTVS